MDINNLDDILRSFGYIKSDNHCNEEDDAIGIDNTAGASSNKCRDFDSDMFLGFQDVDPMFANVLCEIVSNVISGDMSNKFSNAYGNWIQLIGQAIVSFNAQQQYFQGGPGRYYNPVYRNVSNPFCTNAKMPNGGEHADSRKTANYYNGKNAKETKKHKTNKDIDDLRKEIKDLKLQIELLKDEINSLK